MTLRNGFRPVGAVLAAFAVSAGIAAAAETYTATAEVKDASGEKKTAPVTIHINHYSTQAESKAVMKALREGGQAAMRKKLEAMKDVGWIDAAKTKTPIKFASSRPTGDGKLVTIVTAKAVVHIGSNLPDAKPKEGYDVATALLVLDSAGSGHGECAPAGKITIKENDAIAIEDYGGYTVWLQGIKKTK